MESGVRSYEYRVCDGGNCALAAEAHAVRLRWLGLGRDGACRVQTLCRSVRKARGWLSVLARGTAELWNEGTIERGRLRATRMSVVV